MNKSDVVFLCDIISPEEEYDDSLEWIDFEIARQRRRHVEEANGRSAWIEAT